jgi:hypothetical protein
MKCRPIQLRFFLILLICFSFHGNAQDNAVETSGDVILFTLPVATLTSTFIIGDGEGSWQFLKGIVSFRSYLHHFQ